MKDLTMQNDSTLTLSAPDTIFTASASDSDEASDDTSSLLELLSRMRELSSGSDDGGDGSDFDCIDDDDDSDGDAPDMDADDFHNKAVDYARRGRYRQAAETCMRGLKYFPKDVDLLADTVKYSSNAGDAATAERYFRILKDSIPFARWNWRAYQFTLDYLIEDNPAVHEQECRLILSNFHQTLPYEERAYLSESELETALGNYERSMEVLAEATRTRSNACMCALRLADMQLERGLYADVVKTASYGIAAAADPQPSINIPYLYYLHTLAKDYLLHCRAFGLNGEDAGKVSAEEIETLKKEYEMMLSEFPRLNHYGDSIQMRLRMLKFLAAEA